MRLIGPPSAPRAVVIANVNKQTGVHPRFVVEMLPELWSAGEVYGIDPVGVIAQAFKETAAGRFGGAVRPEFFNTCGLKVRHLGLFPGVDDGDNPLAHARFANWTNGAHAHVQHLAKYAGQPVTGLIVDPRYFLVGGAPVETFEELSSRWAPAADYGQTLVAIARRLQATT
jgi:hypothetical protein